MKAEQLIVQGCNVLCKWVCMGTDGCQNGPNGESAPAVKTRAVLTNSGSKNLCCIPNSVNITGKSSDRVIKSFKSTFCHVSSWRFRHLQRKAALETHLLPAFSCSHLLCPNQNKLKSSLFTLAPLTRQTTLFAVVF